MGITATSSMLRNRPAASAATSELHAQASSAERQAGSSPLRRRARAATLALLAFAALGATAAGPAHAVPEPAPGWQSNAPAAPSSAVCGKWRQEFRSVSFRTCLVYYRNTSGTYYYQGVLEVLYQSREPAQFGGKSMSVRRSTGKATGVRDCPRVTWYYGTRRYCYSPTVTYRGRDHLYSKGYLITPAGSWYPVWSDPPLATR